MLSFVFGVVCGKISIAGGLTRAWRHHNLQRRARNAEALVRAYKQATGDNATASLHGVL